MDHDEFNCECHETCSYCSDNWELRYLKPDPKGWGTLVCPNCRSKK